MCISLSCTTTHANTIPSHFPISLANLNLVQKNDQLPIQGLKYYEPVALVDQNQSEQHMIRLGYRALVHLVFSVDAEQQTQRRAIYHTQNTTNATEINKMTTVTIH